MKEPSKRVRRYQARAVGVVASIAFFGVAAGASFELDEHPTLPTVAPTSAAPAPVTSVALGAIVTAPAKPAAFAFLDSLVGLSGKLRARFVSSGSPSMGIGVLEQLFGDSALTQPGIHPLADASRSFSLITMLPFSAKIAGRIGTYRMGNWPFEHRPPTSPEYASPDGFIEVTAQNETTFVSEHFRLSDFLTHDQQDTWPKYLVLNERLVDKLELVIQDLNAHGVKVEHLAIMSGFRTPEYNVQGVGKGGRVRDSRHQYGDAADVYVDNDGRGRMDDLYG